MSIIPGLGHIYLHRYIRGLFFQIVELIFLGTLIHIIFDGKDQMSLTIYVLVALIVGWLYIAAEDTQVICKRIRNGWYANGIVVDDSEDPDSLGGSYCVAPLLMGFIIALSGIGGAIRFGTVNEILPGILIGAAFFIAGLLIARFEDRLIRY